MCSLALTALWLNVSLPVQVFVEAADLDKLNQARQDTKAEMDRNLADTNKTLDTMRHEVNPPPHSSTLFDEPHRLSWSRYSTWHSALPKSLACGKGQSGAAVAFCGSYIRLWQFQLLHVKPLDRKRSTCGNRAQSTEASSLARLILFMASS